MTKYFTEYGLPGAAILTVFDVPDPAIGEDGDMARSTNGTTYVKADGAWAESSGGGGTPTLTDVGFVNVTLQDVTVHFEFANPSVSVAPAHDGSEPAGLVRSFSALGSDMTPLLNFIAGDEIQVLVIGGDLTPDLWSEIEFFGQITFWDQAGANLLWVSVGLGGIDSDTVEKAGGLSVNQQIGTDLNVSEDSSSVVSTAGGAYNVTMWIQCAWDD